MKNLKKKKKVLSKITEMLFVTFCRQAAELIGYFKSVSAQTWKKLSAALKAQ